MALEIVSHEGILNSAKNKGNDQLEYLGDYAFARANLQPISTAQKQTELGIETLAMYTCYLDRISDTDVAAFTIGSRIRVRPIGGSDYRKFLVQSKPIVHESELDLAHIEIVLKEDLWLTP